MLTHRVEWGSDWIAGVVTSRRQAFNSEGAAKTVYRVLDDATAQHRSQASWHDLCEVHWRTLPAQAVAFRLPSHPPVGLLSPPHFLSFLLCHLAYCPTVTSPYSISSVAGRRQLWGRVAIAYASGLHAIYLFPFLVCWRLRMPRRAVLLYRLGASAQRPEWAE